jgi:hypothetical protein
MRNGVALALAVALVAGCGGGDGSDRETFVRDMNEACRDYRAAAEADRPPEEQAAQWTEALEEEIERWREIEPPDADRSRYEEMIRHQEEGLDAWKEFVRLASAGDYEQADPLPARYQKSFVTGARIAGELGLEDCDRALS